MKEIKDVLTKFQKGYEEKIAENASSLVAEVFSERQDLMILGTGSWEVCLGREEVTKLIHDDWDGAWGDFTIDIDGAKIETDNDVAWFYANCTVKYSFEDSDDKGFKRLSDWVKEISENQNATPKQRLSFLNWALSLRFHQRKHNKRDYLWPSELSGLLVKENGVWKIATLHFTIVKPIYPDERFEETVVDYQKGHNHTKKKILAHISSKIDNNLLELLSQLESEMINDAELSGLRFDSDQSLVFDTGQFMWIIALGTTKQNISESEIFVKSLQEIGELFNSDLSSEDKLFQAKRSIAYALKESALSIEHTYPIRLTAVVEKTANGYKFRDKHFSYPFYWILEGKL